MKRISITLLFSALVMLINGCSSDYLKTGNNGSVSRSLPKLPEIKTQKVLRSQPIKRPKVTRQKQYNITSTYTVLTDAEQVEINNRRDAIKKPDTIKKQSVVEVDPYSSIPESSAAKTSSLINDKTILKKSSPAVQSLLVRARVDIAVGNAHSAINKLERGLRIDSQNPMIWHLLAKAQNRQKNYKQAITMAMKSNRFSDDDDLISSNWILIKQAGEKTNDPIVIKEALNYFKANP